MKNSKKTFFICIILLSSITFSQKKVKEIKLDKNENLNFFKASDNGTILYKTNKEVYGVVYRTYKDNKLYCLDNNLNTIFAIDVANTFPKGFVETTKNFQYTINSDELIDEKGNIRSYPYGKKNTFLRIDKESGLNPIFRFFNDYGWTLIGPKSGRLNFKKKYNENDIFIFNMRNNDIKGEVFHLKTPKIITNQKVVSWQLLKEHSKKSFFLVSKDKISKDFSNEVYHIVEHSYTGEIESYTKLNIKLEDSKYFLPTHTNEGAKNNQNSAYGGAFGYGDISIDNSKNTILVYGYYSNKKGKQHRVGKVNGIYAYKFKKDGKLLWKSFFPFKKPVKNYLINRKIEIRKMKNNATIHCYMDDLNGFFKINLNNGEISNNSLAFNNFLSEKKIQKDSYFFKLKMMRSVYFIDTFKDKVTNKNEININLLCAITLKPEIKDFIIERSKNLKNMIYNAEFSDNDIFITEIESSKTRNSKEKSLSIFKF